MDGSRPPDSVSVIVRTMPSRSRACSAARSTAARHGTGWSCRSNHGAFRCGDGIRCCIKCSKHKPIRSWRACRGGRVWRSRCNERSPRISVLKPRASTSSRGSWRCRDGPCSVVPRTKASRSSNCLKRPARKRQPDISQNRRSRSARSPTWSATQSRLRFIAPSNAGIGRRLRVFAGAITVASTDRLGNS